MTDPKHPQDEAARRWVEEGDQGRPLRSVAARWINQMISPVLTPETVSEMMLQRIR